MLYFIPAWYQQNQWCESEQNWHRRRMRTEFDDSVKQIQLFHRSGVYPYQIMLLSCAPNFRHFLHRQSVYHAPYWSCFDAIQEVRRKQVMTLSFHNLNWPSDIEFEYTPFVVVALLHGEKYALIEFGEDGNPIQIDLFENGKIKRRNLYDDRGFISSTTVYEAGEPLYQDYLTEKGTWKLRCYQADGHVEVNPKEMQYLLLFQGEEKKETFLKQSYENLDQVIKEVLIAYLRLTDEEDIFCVAMHEQHAVLLGEALKGKKKILSFYENRYDVKAHPETADMVETADYIIADSRENVRDIQRKSRSRLKKITDISPFDSRVDFGISQQLNVQKILVPVDEMMEETFAQLIKYLGIYLLQNENAQIHLFTRQADYGRKSQLLMQARLCLKNAGLEEEWAAEQVQGKMAENRLEDATPVRFVVEQCVDELSVSKCMREQRLIVDMRKKVVELYLRISAISVGIPQIVYTQTKFVEDGKNGFVLQDLSRLPETIDFYLGSLKNWNEAMVYAYELGKKYTTKELIEKWREVISSV